MIQWFIDFIRYLWSLIVPRQIKIYDKFHGGLNNSADPRDIAQDELSDINNMMVDKVGTIRTIGSVVAATGITATIPTITVPTGRGLFVFKSDYTVTHQAIGSVSNSGGNALFTSTDWLIPWNDTYVYHYGFTNASYNGKKSFTYVSDHSYTTGDAFDGNDTGTLAIIVVPSAGLLYGTYQAPAYLPEWYIVTADASSVHGCSVLAVNEGGWLEDVIDFGSTTGLISAFYFANGFLRVCDRHAGVNAAIQLFGYLKSEISALIISPCWVSIPAKPAQPDTTSVDGGIVVDYDAITGVAQAGSTTTSLVGTVNFAYSSSYSTGLMIMNVTEGTEETIAAWPGSAATLTTSACTNWLGDTFNIYPATGTAFVVGIKDTAGGTWQASSNIYEFAQTFIYDGTQETLPSKVVHGTVMVWGGAGNWTPADNTYLTIRVHVEGRYHARVTGGRVYYRVYGSDDPWKLLVDIDLIRGIRSTLDGQFTAWTSGLVNAFYAEAISYDPQTITYEDINGIPQDTQMRMCSFGSACVLNKRVFIANIVYDLGGSTYAVYGDRIQYTSVGKYDLFPDAFYLDLALDDGDEFIVLQGFADRILAFKNRKLYIINVSQPADSEWYVEAIHPNMGVATPGATFACEEGIVWVNDYGCFLYNGEAITNFITKEAIDTEGRAQRTLGKIDENTWNDFLTASAVVGVDPLLHQIIVIGDSTVAGGNIYVYDMLTEAWSKGDKFSQSAGDKYTNFAIYDNQLIIGHSVV